MGAVAVDGDVSDLRAAIAASLTEVASGNYRDRMKSVGLKILRNRLSEYVKLAAGGETVLVTDRDRVVAELVPPGEGRSPGLNDALLVEAVRRGWITPPTLPAAIPPRAPVTSLRKLLRELSEDRMGPRLQPAVRVRDLESHPRPQARPISR
jgi:antitoxin (DNA-binding transcriptional repressor) of toxin-antitoxin stability system